MTGRTRCVAWGFLAAWILGLPSLAPASIRLGGPEVVKLSWNSRALTACDLDGDGRLDLITADNDRARLDLMYQRKPGEAPKSRRIVEEGRWNPVLEDGLFRIESVTTGVRLLDLALADLNGDGRVDIAYTGRPDGLTVRYQSRKGGFEETRTFSLRDPSSWVGTIAAEDVTGDGRFDLVVLGASALHTFIQTREGSLLAQDAFPLTGDERYGLKVADVDGDGIRDLMYQVSGSDRAVRVRLGTGGGSFGAERSIRLKTRRGRMGALPASDGPPRLVSINHTTGAVETVQLLADSDDEVEFADLQPRVIAAAEAGEGGRSLYAVGDFDGDGRTDLAVANASAASMAILVQKEGRRFVRTADFPSLAEVRGLDAGDIDGDGRDDLIMVSPTEKAVAWTSLDDGGRLRYPKPLPVEDGKPLGVAVGEIDGSMAYAYTLDRKSERLVVVSRRRSDGSWDAREVALEGLRVPPRGLKMLDANQDDRLDLVVFSAHEPARILLSNNDGGFVSASQATGFQQGLLDDLSPSALSTGDVDGDGRDEMLVSASRFVRALRVDASGALEVVDQYNRQACDGELEGAAVWSYAGGGRPEIVLIGAGGACLERLTSRRDGVFRSRGFAELPTLEFQQAEVVALGSPPSDDLLLFGTDRIVWLTTAGFDLVARTEVIHETDTLEINHSLLLTGDLNGDGEPEIVVVDSSDSRMLEVLQLEGNAWSSVMRFKVFEVDPHYEGQTGAKYEPRNGLIVDVTNDGRNDLVLLVHDRLLIYPQVAGE